MINGNQFNHPKNSQLEWYPKLLGEDYLIL
jgi:hypothetical protein